MIKLSGVFPVLPTPFLADGAIDPAALAARGPLDSLQARATGPRFDAGDEAELAAPLDETADLFAIHPLRTNTKAPESLVHATP